MTEPRECASLEQQVYVRISDPDYVATKAPKLSRPSFW